MKELAIMMACLFFYQMLTAQTWSEWFRQNHTQLKYLEEQIAALQEYNVVQTAGYAADDEGLGAIDSTEEADYELHEEHIEGLRRVAAAIRDDPRILRIVSLCTTTSTITDVIRLSGESKGVTDLTGKMREWFANNIDQSLGSLSERLVDLTTPGVLQMTDAERERDIGGLESEAETLNSRTLDYLEHIIISNPS